MIRRAAPFVGVALGLAVFASGVALLRPPTAPARADEVTAPAASPAASPAPLPPVARTPEPTSAPLGRGWRISVARIGIDLPIMDGDPARDIELQDTPDGAAYRLAGSALPGTSGNTYIYGHARWAQFIGLWYAHLDDLIVVSGPATTLYYRVAEIHPRVAIDDITYLVPSNTERLTLQTSSGPNPDDPRFVVVALPAR